MEKKLVEKPAEEQKRDFGSDKMHLAGEIKPLVFKGSKEKKRLITVEVWESKRKCICKDIGLTSAVRVDVLRHSLMIDGFTVYEIKDGKVLESRFNSLLEPAAGGTSPASLVEEHRRKLEDFMNGEFFRHVMDNQEELTRTIIQGVGLEIRYVYLSKKIVSEMQIEHKMSCKMEEGRDSEGAYLRMTPLKTTAIQMRVQKGTTSYFVDIPENILPITGLKIGDRITWQVGEEGLFLRKAEVNDRYARKVLRDNVSTAVTIPEEFIKRFELEKIGYGIWTFDKDDEGKLRLWLEFSKENPHITAIRSSMGEYVKYNKGNANQFYATILKDMGEWLKAGDEVTLEPMDGKLYIRKKQG
jgi:antitoxin component of MazEF toxin-antitoxin module